MKIYLAHSREFDYINDIYIPIRNDNYLKHHEIILPHEKDKEEYNGKEFYGKFDLIIAEISFPSTGLGIELGWAFDENVPIYCLYKNGYKFSSSLKAISNNFYEYKNENEFIEIVKNIVKK